MKIRRVNCFQQCLAPTKYSINIIYYLKPLYHRGPPFLPQMCYKPRSFQPSALSKVCACGKFFPYTAFHCLTPTCPQPFGSSYHPPFDQSPHTSFLLYVNVLSFQSVSDSGLSSASRGSLWTQHFPKARPKPDTLQALHAFVQLMLSLV